MGEVISLEEITRRYADQWVLIGDPQIGPYHAVKGGRVLFASPDRDLVYQKASEIAPGDFAVRYTGGLPDDMAFVL